MVILVNGIFSTFSNILILYIFTKKQGKWRESRNGHLFWYPHNRKAEINILIIIFVKYSTNGKKKREREREVKKKQRI